MRKIFIILIFLIASIAVMRGQEIEGTAPISIDRAMSVWARDRVNINFDSIYQRAGDSTWVTITATEITATDVTADSLSVRAVDADTIDVEVLKPDSLSTGAIYYNDTYYDDLRVPLTNTRINPANSEPDFENMGNGAFAWGFDANADSTHALHFMAQLSHRYKVGPNLIAHIHWSPPTTNTGVVRWKLSYWLASIDGTMAGPYYFWVNDAGDGTAYKHQLANFGTINGSTLGVSSMIIGRVARVGTAAADTYTGSAYGWEIDFHFEIDSPGTREEYTK